MCNHDTGKRDATALAEASWNGPSPGWMEQLGALSSVTSDVGQHNNVRHGIYRRHFCNITCTAVRQHCFLSNKLLYIVSMLGISMQITPIQIVYMQIVAVFCIMSMYHCHGMRE